MKASIIKRMLTGALIASLVMAPAMSVAAASSDAPEGSTVVEQVVESTTTTSVAEVPAKSTVAGVVTTTKGVYLATIDAAAASQGGEVGPMINLEFGKMAGGKYSLLSSDGPAIQIALGIPKSFAQAGKTYAMVRVQAGGVVTILPDIDDNPNTITFATTGGAGAYAIIRF